MLIQNCEIPTRGKTALRIQDGCIQEIGAALSPRAKEEIFDSRGGAVLPGLHDHHLHLLALAATQNSVCCGPPAITNEKMLIHALRNASSKTEGGNSSLRGFAYHESVAGELDRWRLDAIRSDVPMRIQHRTGALWIFNSRAIDTMGLDRGVDHPGVERDAQGRATGRLFRDDAFLRDRLDSILDRDGIAHASRKLANFGITTITDASVSNRIAEWNLFSKLIQDGVILQNMQMMGDFDFPTATHASASTEHSSSSLPSLQCSAQKILLYEGGLPSLEEFIEKIHNAHLQDRGVAIHCVTRTELIFAASALAQAGLHRADRIEHASVAPPDAIALLTALRPSSIPIVTQPHFLFERGDQYLHEVEPQDRPWLYRGRGFLEAGLPLRAGSDAPYGNPDPWLSMRCAIQRKTASGISFAANEALSPEEALLLFMPITKNRNFNFESCLREMLSPGKAADLCLLDRPWHEARTTLSTDMVRAVFRAGVRIDRAIR